MSFQRKRCDIHFWWALGVSHLFCSRNIMSPNKGKKGAGKAKKGSRSGNGDKHPKKGAGKEGPFLHGPRHRGKALAWQPSKEHPIFKKIVRYPADHPAEELRGQVNINESRTATREAAIAFMDQNAVRLFDAYSNTYASHVSSDQIAARGHQIKYGNNSKSQGKTMFFHAASKCRVSGCGNMVRVAIPKQYAGAGSTTFTIQVEWNGESCDHTAKKLKDMKPREGLTQKQKEAIADQQAHLDRHGGKLTPRALWGTWPDSCERPSLDKLKSYFQNNLYRAGRKKHPDTFATVERIGKYTCLSSKNDVTPAK